MGLQSLVSNDEALGNYDIRPLDATAGINYKLGRRTGFAFLRIDGVEIRRQQKCHHAHKIATLNDGARNHGVSHARNYREL